MLPRWVLQFLSVLHATQKGTFHLGPSIRISLNRADFILMTIIKIPPSLANNWVWAAYFGDPEFAIEAVEKGGGIEAGGFFFVWSPITHDVRQQPRFKEFVREIGLVDYWNKFGWPDICHKLDNGDFVCD